MGQSRFHPAHAWVTSVSSHVDTILYFGCRSASSDHFYASEWHHYRKIGVRIEVAASRDQDEKLYVQHLIRRDAPLIKRWVVDRRGSVYISG